MLVGSGSFDDPATLVGWGGSIATRTTNGEWWRLLTMTFVHAGLLHLLVEVGALVSVGLVLERLLGPLAFGGVYVAAGLLAALVSVSAHPLDVSFGASWRILGVYGLLASSTIWGFVRRSTVTLPLTTAKTLVPIAAVFILYSLATDHLHGDAELVGLVVGFLCGLVLARRADETPRPLRWSAVSLRPRWSPSWSWLFRSAGCRTPGRRSSAWSPWRIGRRGLRRRGQSLQERMDQPPRRSPASSIDDRARASDVARTPRRARQSSGRTAVARRQRRAVLHPAR